MSNKAKLTEEKKFWKARGENGASRNIPLDELSDDHLQRAYFVTQNKELENTNKSIRFAELAETFHNIAENLEDEAKVRGLTLRSIEDEPSHKIKKYFENNRKLKSR